MINISKDIQKNILEQSMSEFFNGKSVKLFEGTFPTYDLPEIIGYFYKDKGKFKITIEFLTLNLENNEFYYCMIKLSKYISQKFNCKTVCDGTLHGNDKDFPYRSILCENGECFLIDDLIFEETGKFNIIKQIFI